MDPSETGKVPARFRRGGILLLVAVVCGTAALLLWRSWGDRTLGRPPSNLGPPQERIAEIPPAGPGNVNARVRVRLFDEAGEMPVGASLEEQVSLKLVGRDGQSYEASFDRAGLWVMEVPAGNYEVPVEQEALGAWRWELAGEAVGELSGEGYPVLFVLGQAPTLELILRR